MPTQVVTQLIVDASGAKTGVADFEAAMTKAKAAAVDGGIATATAFETAQRRWTNALGATDPVIKAQIRMQDDLAKQTLVGNRAVELGIATQAAAASQLDNVRKKHEANIQAIREQTGQLTLGEKAMAGFASATSGVSGQLIAMQAGAGPVGVFLAALGPVGLAAAVGLGAVAAAFNYVTSEAERMGHKSMEVRQFQEATGLTVAQISALKHAAAEFGTSGDAIQSSFERLTFSMNAAHRATGTLYDDVRLVDGGLAEQLRATHTVAEGIDVLAQAWKRAGDESQKAAIARAAFGRAGVSQGPVLGVIADAGGIANLKAVNEATDEQTKSWAKMQAQIDELNKRAKNILASIFTPEGLAAQLVAAEYMERTARAAKDLADQKEGLSWWQQFVLQLATIEGGAPSNQNELVALETAKKRVSGALSGGTNLAVSPADLGSWQRFEDVLFGIQTPAAHTVMTLTQMQDAVAGEAKVERERIGVLGSAATIDDHRLSRLKDLQSALLDNKISQQDYTKAIAATNLDAAAQKESTRISQLGELASVQEIVRQKEDALQKSIREGVAFSPQELAAIRTRNQLLAENSKIENQMVFDRQQLFKSQVDQSIDQTLRSAGIPPASDRAAAIRDYMRMTDNIKTMRESGLEFAQTFVKGLLSGKSAVDSMIAGFDQLAQKMTDKALVDLFSGNFLQAAVEATVAAVAALSSAFLKSSEAQQKAAANLAKANADAQKLSADIGGAGGSGSIAQHMTDINNQVTAALAAFHGQVTQAGLQLFNDEQAFFTRSVKDFLDNWQASLNQIGDNSEFDSARANVAKFAQTIQDFVGNTRDLGSAAQVSQAQAAGQKALLATLAATPQLSDTATQFQRIMGTAAGLTAALTTLGLSSAEAAKAINAGVSRALDELTKTFTTGLTARLNVANNQSYLNDITTLLAQHASDIADALSLGDPALASLVDSVFTAEAQKIVNDAGLVGSAFADLTNQFPQLVGVVHEATQAVKDQAAAQSDLNNAAKGVVDYLNGLLSGSASTLSPQAILANAQSAYNANTALAQSGNLDAVNKFPELAENLRKAAETMYGSSTAYQAILQQIISQGLALPAVQQADDPVVVALRDVLDAIHDGNISAATTAINTGNTLTGPQLTAMGLAKDATAINLLTVDQVRALGLSTDIKLGTLLTPDELTAAKLASDATVGGLLSAAAFVQADLATNPTLVDANTAIGKLLTPHDLAASGLAADTTVQGLFTAAQLAQAGLATNAVLNGQLTQQQVAALNLAVNPTVAALLTRDQVLALGLAANVTLGNVVSNTGDVAGNTAATANNIGASGDQGIRGILNLLTSQFTAHGVSFNITGQYIDQNTRQLVNTSSSLTITNNMIDALNKIVGNTKLAVDYLNFISRNIWPAPGSSPITGGPSSIGVFATGGMVGGTGTGTSDSNLIWASVGEGIITASRMSALGGRSAIDNLNAGRVPVLPVIQGATNDNGGIVAEIRALRAQNERMEKMLAASLARIAQLEQSGNDALYEQGERQLAATNRPKTATRAGRSDR